MASINRLVNKDKSQISDEQIVSIASAIKDSIMDSLREELTSFVVRLFEREFQKRVEEQFSSKGIVVEIKNLRDGVVADVVTLLGSERVINIAPPVINMEIPQGAFRLDSTVVMPEGFINPVVNVEVPQQRPSIVNVTVPPYETESEIEYDSLGRPAKVKRLQKLIGE